ncbi:MAG: response regulator [Patescibacteria group bacterium]|nr:response regulator [Patescibacteria group bacterium]
MESKKNKILLVDDDEDIRTMYANLLRENSFEVIEAKDGVEGLDLAASSEGVDLIFTGIIMPRMDGFQLIQSLKEYTSTANIPVIVSSHLGREEDRKHMDKLGVKDFIVQGMTTPAEVIKRILQAIRHGEYDLGINPLEFDGQRFIEDYNFSPEMKCENCGSELALNIKYYNDKVFKAYVHCPNCQRKY